MEKKQYLVITLPESLAELPVRIERSPGCQGIVLNLSQEEIAQNVSDVRKYAFIWRQTDYLKVVCDDILWIEANGSYSKVCLREGRSMLLSFNLSQMERDLPEGDFVRIHRSYIVNLKNVVSLVGNSLRIADRFIPIGREYREAFFQNFIFLGVRRNKKGQ